MSKLQLVLTAATSDIDRLKKDQKFAGSLKVHKSTAVKIIPRNNPTQC